MSQWKTIRVVTVLSFLLLSTGLFARTALAALRPDSPAIVPPTTMSASEVCKLSTLTPENRAQLKCDDREKAIEYLVSIACTGKADCYGRYDRAHIEPLDPNFLICTYKLAKSMNDEKPGSICVCQAARTSEEQRASCNRPNQAVCGRQTKCGGTLSYCPHVKGIAIDLNESSRDYPRLWKAASQFGLKSPLEGDDPPHIEPANRTSITCASVGYTPGNLTDGPATAGNGSGITSQQTSAIANVMKSLGNFLAPPPPNPYAQMAAQQPISAAQNPFSYIPPSSASSSPTITAPGTTNPNTSGTDTRGSGVNVSDLIDTDKNKKAGTSTAAIDLINALGGTNTVATTPAATGTSVALSSGLGATVALQGTRLASSSALSPTTTTYTLSSNQMQTFTTQDLSKTPMKRYSQSNISSTFRLLENIKQVLITILQLLRPFGGTLQRPAANSATAVLR